MSPLKNRVAVITGGAQGIGKAMARHFLGLGMRVAVADVDEEAGRETEAEYAGLGEFLFVPADVASEGDVQRALALTVEAFGQVDALINNAGPSNPLNAGVENLSLEDWNRVLAAHLTGAFLCVKHAVPYLRKARGSVVNIASTRAIQSEARTEAYSAAKGGIVALTHALAVSLGPEIRVNCISPGWIEVSAWKKTRLRHEPELNDADRLQHLVGRVGEPRDVATLAAFLISDDAGFITGQNIVADGGMTRKMIYVE